MQRSNCILKYKNNYKCNKNNLNIIEVDKNFEPKKCVVKPQVVRVQHHSRFLSVIAAIRSVQRAEIVSDISDDRMADCQAVQP